MIDKILDTSVLLAFILGEPHQVDANELLAGACVSAISLAEFRGVLARHDIDQDMIAATIGDFALKVMPFGEAEADIVGRLITPARALNISIGDLACIATGQIEGLTVWTANRDWLSLGSDAQIQLIR